MGESHVISFSNFNPAALFSLILLGVVVVLASVSMGIGQWSRFDTDRMDSSIVDGATLKTQSLLSRCVSYELTQEIVELGLSSEQQPQFGCLSVSEIDCSSAGLPLVSALDSFNHTELHNSHDEGKCEKMKLSMQASAAVFILGIVATFISMLLYFPLWHFGFFIAGAVLAVISVVLYAIGLGVFLDQEQDFAGYFSLDGSPHDGCLSYGFGIALSAFIINIIATIVGLLAICYKKMFPSKFQYTVKED